jgi:hypothetical protein
LAKTIVRSCCATDEDGDDDAESCDLFLVANHHHKQWRDFSDSSKSFTPAFASQRRPSVGLSILAKHSNVALHWILEGVFSGGGATRRQRLPSVTSSSFR